MAALLSFFCCAESRVIGRLSQHEVFAKCSFLWYSLFLLLLFYFRLSRIILSDKIQDQEWIQSVTLC